jgi:dTDP-4-amino-4,6-dideoxygalactose transaminase
MKKPIFVNEASLGEEEIEAVVNVLRRGILTEGLGKGPMVRQFEESFSKMVKAKHGIAVINGTAALHASLLAAGIKQNDEVIVPSFTFVATAEAVLLAGGKPVFVDIDPNTYNINPQNIEKAINKKTKAIIPVDLYGLPANMQFIYEIAKKHDLIIIEDACQAHGAKYRNKPPGYFADMTCWSFYQSKNITTGEGGMITTNNDEYAEKLRCIRSHGEKEKYKTSMLGHNYRMPETEAAIGIAQLKKFSDFLEKRAKNAEQLTKKLAETEKIQLPFQSKDYQPSWYLYTIRLKKADRERRDNFVETLKNKGIYAGVYYYTPIHLMPYYQIFAKQRLPETEKASDQVLSLPVHPNVTEEQICYIAETVLTHLK